MEHKIENTYSDRRKFLKKSILGGIGLAGTLSAIECSRKKQQTSKMLYIITDDCINCGICPPECEFSAIIEKNAQYIIDPGKCTGCGKCADVCPVYAIVGEKLEK